MSKAPQKQEKVTLEEDKISKSFENAPKLFSKWSYDDIKVTPTSFRLKIPASSTISQPSPPKHKSSSLTPQADIKPKSSERLSAPSSKDSLAPCNSTEETQAKKSKPSVSSDTPSKSFISLLAEIPLKSLSDPCFRQDLEKTLPESELVVWLESKLWTFLPWEEWTRLSTWSPKEPESTQWKPKRPSPSAWLTRSWTPRKETSSPAMPWRRNNKSRKLLRATVECCMTYLIIYKTINSSPFKHRPTFCHK